MDLIPYNFVDRVFTKLDVIDIYMLSSSSPVWMEASQVYNKKLQLLNIEIAIATDEASFLLHIDSIIRKLPAVTYEALPSSDSRFIRIEKLRIFKGQTNRLDSVHFPIEHLSAVFRSFSRFRIVELDTRVFLPSTDLVYGCLINQLKPEKLYANDTQVARGFLQNQLQSLELRNLKLFSSGQPDLKAEIEAFVCKDKFQYLECRFECLGMDCVKRIVAYWRARQNPWKSSESFFTRAPILKLKTNRDLTNDFAAWLTPTLKAGEFREENGSSTLVVNCNASSCKIQFT